MDIEQKLTDIDKKLSKILNLNTKIAKALHLLPVTPKEERAIQLLQRKNAQLTFQIFDEIEKMDNPDSENEDVNLFNYEETEVYDDVVGDDFLDDFRKGGI